ncbi:hypothetical protein HMPREF3196_02161 [Bifidobacterium bifidum]|uniref:Uncharacterized protein n=1 Tax=Bifidobacterium bifidum TaxID=1681 RepID=A0A133KK07_BIFBI|nr:hypothetical protein HMPREF3196_02161 [Bifidobacterium bifidum]KXS26323.1 MAG: hypothetical protein AYW85_05395 [Bifidobacterium bifidum]
MIRNILRGGESFSDTLDEVAWDSLLFRLIEGAKTEGFGRRNDFIQISARVSLADLTDDIHRLIISHKHGEFIKIAISVRLLTVTYISDLAITLMVTIQ